MTEEKPASERSERPDPLAPVEAVIESAEAAQEERETPPADAGSSEVDEVIAALSALMNAADPARDEGAAHDEAPAPEDAVVASTPAPSDSSSLPQDAPPPASPDRQGSHAPLADDDARVESYPPPTGMPVAASPMPTAPLPASAAAPAPDAKRKKWPWVLALCIVAGVLLIGGIAACTSAVMTATIQNLHGHERNGSVPYSSSPFGPGMQDHLWGYYNSGIVLTFDELLDIFDVDEGGSNADGVYTEGAYRVGGTNGIAAGLYYFEGAQDDISDFYVFHSRTSTEKTYYSLEASIEYFGNYYAELEEGDVVVFLPSDQNRTMHVASSQPMGVMPPYKSGCYRVGIDIPAGTYTITYDADVARETDSEAGAFVMDDVDFEADEPFVSESAYVIKGGRQAITVEDGEYLELFAAIATPATASTKVPLQHIESELPYAA